MKSTVLVLFAKSVDFTDKDKNHVQSLKVSYVSCDPEENGKGEQGIPVVDGASLPFDQLGELKEVPGYYDLGFSPTPAKNSYGKQITELKPRRLSFRGGAAHEVAKLIAAGNTPVAVVKS